MRPDLPFEGPQASADFDPKTFEQLLANGRIVHARRNAHGIEHRQLVPFLGRESDPQRGQPGFQRLEWFLWWRAKDCSRPSSSTIRRASCKA